MNPDVLKYVQDILDSISKIILVHDYDLIDDPTIWRICQNNLPVLKNEILGLIENK